METKQEEKIQKEKLFVTQSIFHETILHDFEI